MVFDLIEKSPFSFLTHLSFFQSLRFFFQAFLSFLILSLTRLYAWDTEVLKKHNKKAGLPFTRQPGYLFRPVTFRPPITRSLALSLRQNQFIICSCRNFYTIFLYQIKNSLTHRYFSLFTYWQTKGLFMFY